MNWYKKGVKMCEQSAWKQVKQEGHYEEHIQQPLNTAIR